MCGLTLLTPQACLALRFSAARRMRALRAAQRRPRYSSRQSYHREAGGGRRRGDGALVQLIAFIVRSQRHRRPTQFLVVDVGVHLGQRDDGPSAAWTMRRSPVRRRSRSANP
jgi:hypothetical protein